MKKTLSVYALGFIAGVVTVKYAALKKQMREEEAVAKAVKNRAHAVAQRDIHLHMHEFNKEQRRELRKIGFDI